MKVNEEELIRRIRAMPAETYRTMKLSLMHAIVKLDDVREIAERTGQPGGQLAKADAEGLLEVFRLLHGTEEETDRKRQDRRDRNVQGSD